MTTSASATTPTDENTPSPFVNNSGIDLSVLQIHPGGACVENELPSFLHACVQSRVFNNSELNFICNSFKTGLDPKDLKTLATQINCHFSVKSLDPSVPDHKKQLKTLVDTRTCESCRDIPLERHVPLLVILGHYVLNTRIYATTYYVKHKAELDQKYPEMAMNVRQRIRTIGKDGRPRFSTDGTSVVNLLRNLFEQHLLHPTRPLPGPEKKTPEKKTPEKKNKPKPVKPVKPVKKEPKKKEKEPTVRPDKTIRVPIPRSTAVSNSSGSDSFNFTKPVFEHMTDSDDSSFEIEDVLE